MTFKAGTAGRQGRGLEGVDDLLWRTGGLSVAPVLHTSRYPPRKALFLAGWLAYYAAFKLGLSRCPMNEALDYGPDMAAGRRDYLKEQLDLLTSNPSAYVTSTGKLRTRRP